MTGLYVLFFLCQIGSVICNAINTKRALGAGMMLQILALLPLFLIALNYSDGWSGQN
jgi:hypothetical protein